MKRSLWLVLPLALTMSCQTTSVAAQCTRLQPMQSPFEGGHDALDFAYFEAISRTLLGQEKLMRDLQMVRLVPGSPEAAVYVVDKTQGDPRKARDYQIVYVEATIGIHWEVRRKGPGVVIPVKTYRAAADVQLVERIRSVWRRMILEARFPKNQHVAQMGAFYEFSTSLDVNHGSAYAHGPATGTCPSDLIDLANELAEYAKAPVARRSMQRFKAMGKAAALLKRLDAKSKSRAKQAK